MSNEPQNNSTEIVPVETAAPLALDVALANTAAMVAAEPDRLFPDGGTGEFYAARLLGVPFVVSSMPLYKMQPARMVAVRDEQGNDTGRTKQIPAHEVAQLTIRLANLQEHTIGPVRIATFSSIYACNQLRNFTEHELFPFVWTVAENPRNDFVLPNGRGPLMLRRWTPELETGDAQDHEMAGSVLATDPIGPSANVSDKPTNKVRAEIARMRSAGVTLG